MPINYAGQSDAGNFVAQLYNDAQELADRRLYVSDQLIKDAINAITMAPQIQEIDILASIDLPAAPDVEGFSAAELTALYQSTADEIKALLANGLVTFFTSYFPLGNELAAARAWIEKAITTGGTGLNPVIEAQIWERDRSRVLRDSARATDEAVSAWAARGYALPPGALVDQVGRIDQDARDKIAQASRDVAIKQAELELENIKFAIEKALDLRKAAIQSANDYIRTLALGPQLGAQLAGSLIDTRAKLADAAVRFYQAKVSALELPAKIAISEAGLNADIRKANLGSLVSTIRARVDTIEAAARQVGTQAAAALNALSASTAFNGNESL